MNIFIKSSHIQFRNPNLGHTSRAIEEHYNGRRIIAIVNGKDEMFMFTKDELPFNATEDDMILAIETKLNAE